MALSESVVNQKPSHQGQDTTAVTPDSRV